MDDEEIRQYLQDLLETTFTGLGVYYRPPGDLILTRPCIIYEAKSSELSFANNLPYVVGIAFQATILSDLPGYADKKRIFSMSGVVVNNNRSYVSNDIVHDVFTLSVNTI
ncbi:MAG: hypothetical protein DRI46_12935 [Chloroflexi bacterium]|nr:MAG: hypothetical protein DRI46_12935 [Chloroflexota bacterium]